MDILIIFAVIIIIAAFLLNAKKNVYQGKSGYKHRHKNHEYERLLHTNEWYSKRNEIFGKRGHKCEWCGTHNYLQLHHKYYLKYPDDKKVNPWEYPDDAFIVLCDNCHKKAHKKYKIKTYYTKRK